MLAKEIKSIIICVSYERRLLSKGRTTTLVLPPGPEHDRQLCRGEA